MLQFDSVHSLVLYNSRRVIFGDIQWLKKLLYFSFTQLIKPGAYITIYWYRLNELHNLEKSRMDNLFHNYAIFRRLKRFKTLRSQFCFTINIHNILLYPNLLHPQLFRLTLYWSWSLPVSFPVLSISQTRKSPGVSSSFVFTS